MWDRPPACRRDPVAEAAKALGGTRAAAWRAAATGDARRRRPGGTPLPGSGFTLLELLLALACVAALASVTIPAMNGLLGDRELARGAAIVRGQLMRSAAEAISTGQPLGLRQEADRWIVGGFTDPDATSTLPPIAGLTVPLMPTDPAASVPPDRDIELPRDVQIAGVWTIPRGTYASAPATAVRCYPDGVCDDARIQITHPAMGDLFVTVRGLTGEVTVETP